MTEFLQGMGVFPDFVRRPDLGGTRFNFVKERTNDTLSFWAVHDGCIFRLQVPSDKSFMKVAIEGGGDGIEVVEAYYDFTGELSSANIWFRRLYGYHDFEGRGKTDEIVNSAYDDLVERSADFMLEADLSMNLVNLYLCTEDSRSDDIDIFEHAECPIPQAGGIVVSSDSGIKDSIRPVRFYAGFYDGALRLGYMPNIDSLNYHLFSTYIDVSKINEKTTPEQFRVTLSNILLWELLP